MGNSLIDLDVIIRRLKEKHQGSSLTTADIINIAQKQQELHQRDKMINVLIGIEENLSQIQLAIKNVD